MFDYRPAKEWKKFLPRGYRKRTVSVEYRNTVSLHGTEWSGGSRSTYTLCNADSGAALPTPAEWARNWNEPSRDHELAPNECIVISGIFCGKTSTARIVFHESRKPAAS